MNILVFSISSPPEKTGIGKYNAEMIEYFAEKGHHTRLLTTLPYYPEWKLLSNYSTRLFISEKHGKANVVRVWSYLPKSITTKARILKEVSFHIMSFIYMFVQKFKGYKPDVIVYVAPPFFLPFVIRLLYRSSKHAYHIQDFEVDAAIELNMLPDKLEGLLKKIEKYLLIKMDLISTISDGMMIKLKQKVDKVNLILFPNWSDTSQIYPSPSKWLHYDLNISEEKKLIVYSGNIGEKQGLDKLPEVINYFKGNEDIHFVIIGEGTYKKTLIDNLDHSGLTNYSLRKLVEVEELNSMLNSSFLQLVLQKSEGADSFLPSKLTNILAAGIPAIVTTLPNTGLFNLIENYNCAITTGDSVEEIIQSIKWSLRYPEKLKYISENAVSYSKVMLDKENILNTYLNQIKQLVKK